MRVFKTVLLLLLWVVAIAARAELNFPALTGRVVDNAQMIEPSVRQQLTQQLQAHEQATGEQLVVVTLPDLQGTDIADFGYQLGRHWGIGQKDKNNGALLIIARDERRLRIEVGYGLEDRLTDAQSSVIINQVITPSFKTGNFSKGISDGVAAMLVVLGGTPWTNPPRRMNPEAIRGGFHRAASRVVRVFGDVIHPDCFCVPDARYPSCRPGRLRWIRGRLWRWWIWRRRWRGRFQWRRGQFRRGRFVRRLVIIKTSRHFTTWHY